MQSAFNYFNLNFLIMLHLVKKAEPGDQPEHWWEYLGVSLSWGKSQVNNFNRPVM